MKKDGWYYLGLTLCAMLAASSIAKIILIILGAQ